TLLGLYSRRRTGIGQLIDSPMTGAALAIGAEQVIVHSLTGEVMSRNGNRSDRHAPYDVYPTSVATDDWVAIAVTTDQQWRALASAIGRPDLADEERFATASQRLADTGEIDAAIVDWLAGRDPADAAEALAAHGVPA